MRYTFNMKDGDILTAIKSYKTVAARQRDRAHQIAVSIAHNWATGGAANVAATRYSQLLDALDDSHKQKLINWCAQFGLEYDKDTTVFAYTATKITAEQFQVAKDKTMFEVTPDQAPKPFDLDKRIMQLIASAERQMKNEKADHSQDNIDPEKLKVLRTLVAA